MAKPRKRRRIKWIIALVLLLAGLGFGAYKFFHKPVEIIEIQVEPVVRRDLTETVMASGKIQPVTKAMISPEVAGEIVALPVKEGQVVKAGDLLLQIKPDSYQASRNSAEASYKVSLGSRSQAEAELARAESEFKRNEELFKNKLISASVFVEFETAVAVARLRSANAIHQVDQAHFALDKADDDLKKTTITSPIDGTVTNLKSQLGERVLGTSFNMGTEMMTIAKLDEMEARIDIGEIDVVLIESGQNVRLEVDAFRDRKFKGTVTSISNASKTPAQGGSQQQEAPKFEVRIRIIDKEAFRPGMSVTAEIETRTRTGVLTVPIQSVTTRLSAPAAASTPSPDNKPASTPAKPREVVFALEGDRVKLLSVATGISDNEHFEIVSGVSEGQKIVTGGYRAISKDLEDGKQVRIGTGTPKKEGP